MKTSVPKTEHASTKKVILPLMESDSKATKLDKYNSKSFDLSVEPGGAAGTPTYKMNGRVLNGTEELRTKIQWVKDVETIIQGLNIDTVAPMMRVIHVLSEEAIYNIVDEALTRHGEAYFESTEMVAAEAADLLAGNNNRVTQLNARGPIQHFVGLRTCLMAAIAFNMPFKTLERVKKSIRRECRKPADLGVRDYISHIHRINNDEIPLIPPGGIAQRFTEDDLIDIILHGTPKSWQREMDRQGFESFEKTLPQVADFMERIEASEEPPKSNTSPNKKGKKNHASKDDWKDPKNKNSKTTSKLMRIPALSALSSTARTRTSRGLARPTRTRSPPTRRSMPSSKRQSRRESRRNSTLPIVSASPTTTAARRMENST